MKHLLAVVLVLGVAGCGTKPCVDGERTSSGGWFAGTTRTSYDPCPQKCCSPEWTRGCACAKRCPCWERHPRRTESGGARP